MGDITRKLANNILGTGEIDATDGLSGTIAASNIANASLDNLTETPASLGYTIKSVASDPSPLTEGQIFYNSTSGLFKGLLKTAAWSSSANMSNSRYFPGGVGTQTDMLAITGQGATAMTTATEEYNGSGWSSGGAVNSARRAVYSFGTPTAAVIAGGDYVGSPGGPLSTATEEYDGSTWTSGNSIVGQGSFGASAGTLTAGLAFGGYNTAQTASSTITVSYDGTSWTSLASPANDTNNARNFTMGGGGTQTAAIFSGGYSNPIATNGALTESWDGSTWTNENNMGTARYGNGFLGTQASGLYAGGATPAKTNVTEEWNGSTWSTSPATLATSRSGSAISKGGSGTTAAIAGGYTGTAFPNATEEYNVSTNTTTAAAWSSGGNMTTPKQDGGSFGIQTAAIGAGGYTIPYTNNSQSYDGSTWTNTPNINTTRTTRGSGTQTAGLIFGGNAPPADATQSATESWNGSTWTTVNSLNTARGGVFSSGTQTASLAAGGSGVIPSANASATESWDGTNWTTLPTSMNTARGGGGTAGTQTSSLIFGGDPNGAPPEITTATESWNGSTWTSEPNMITARNGNRGSGLQTAALAFGGFNDGASIVYASTEAYDGTSWATSQSMATTRGNGHSAGVGSPTASSTLAFGGSQATPSYLSATEEFTGETVTQVARTLSSS